MSRSGSSSIRLAEAGAVIPAAVEHSGDRDSDGRASGQSGLRFRTCSRPPSERYRRVHSSTCLQARVHGSGHEGRKAGVAAKHFLTEGAFVLTFGPPVGRKACGFMEMCAHKCSEWHVCWCPSLACSLFRRTRKLKWTRLWADQTATRRVKDHMVISSVNGVGKDHVCWNAACASISSTSRILYGMSRVYSRNVLQAGTASAGRSTSTSAR